MHIGTITQLWRYPVKSMGGERLRSATLARRGIPGDRGWAVYDETRGGITTAKRLPRLRDCRARYTVEPEATEASPRAEVTFPDGTSMSTDTSELAQRLSALVGPAVSLRALGAAGSEAPPRVTTAGESPEAIRALMGILPDEPEPDYRAFTPERLRALRQGNFFDAFPLHLLTRTTLRTLARLAPESDWNERRFRANLIVEAEDGDGFPELDWVGRKLRIGQVLLDVVMGCPRCVMVTLAENDLPQDLRMMRTLVRRANHLAGIYLSVNEAGEVSEGDAIELAG
jgi:uncharacterized protein YcbX